MRVPCVDSPRAPAYAPGANTEGVDHGFTTDDSIAADHSMTGLGYVAVALPVGVAAYAYFLYPVLLKALALSRRKDANGRRGPATDRKAEEWPRISITVPMFNEEAQAEELLDSLLALEYPADRKQIVVVSDASSDRTDQIVDSYADRGVELIRHPERVGKTEAENRAAEHLTGDIVVNTDASIRIRSDALKILIAAFSGPRVGLASGRDISVSRARHKVNLGESGYVGYEMWIRDLETATSGIVGASGCFYAIRSDLHRIPVPDSLSRDFAAAILRQAVKRTSLHAKFSENGPEPKLEL